MSNLVEVVVHDLLIGRKTLLDHWDGLSMVSVLVYMVIVSL